MIMQGSVIVPAVRKSSGFNLIEIAIVLAVIGVIIGGIYVFASSVMEKNKQQEFTNQILILTQNIRSAYSVFGLPPTAPSASIGQISAQRLVSDGVAPAGFSVKNSLELQGSYGVVTVSNASNKFRVLVADLSQSMCIRLLIDNFSNAGSTKGLDSVAGYNNGAYLFTTHPVNGVSLTQAQNLCQGAGNVNMLSFTFWLSAG